MIEESENINILYDCISAADVVCTQNSSIGMDALYFNKPFYFTSLNENYFAEQSILYKLNYAPVYTDLKKFTDHLTSLNFKNKIIEIEKLKNQVIYTEPLSSVTDRLIKLLEKICSTKI